MAISDQSITEATAGQARDASESTATLLGPTISWSVGSVALEISLSERSVPWVSAFSVGPVGRRIPFGLPLVDVVTVDAGHTPASGRLVHSALGEQLQYRSHRVDTHDAAATLTVELAHPDRALEATIELVVPAGTSVVRSRVRVRNADNARAVILRSVTSFATYLGSDAAGRDGAAPNLRSAASDWLGEGRWQTTPLDSLLPHLDEHLTGHNPRGAHRVASTGTWSTGRHLPTAAITVGGATWAWQIEHNGGWVFEVGADTVDMWFALAGPTDDDHQWVAPLAPGQTFESVPVAVTLARSFEEAVGELTAYRRATRRAHPDNAAMPVVFNDYMNTLNGDPTTERLLPLISAAAEVGCEIFCIDAGWYADGFWWDSVGEWLPSTGRFPGGLGEVIDSIRDHGMTPGLWLEPEVIGVNSPVAALLPESAFLTRHGQRLVEHDRYHLDLRDASAVKHLDAVVDRLIADFGIGFFKFDYNINPGPGTDHDADSVGGGLLQHNRAHLAWLDAVLDRHPDLVIENCGSGAMRSDFAMLSRLQMQSTSDQQDFSRFPPIAASAPAQMLPEQAANWAYPQPEMTDEEIAFCLVTGLLGRFYLSGYLNRMPASGLAMVRGAVSAAKSLRRVISSSTPFWPLGLPAWEDRRIALGLLHGPDAGLDAGPGDGEERYLSLWDRAGDDTEILLPLTDLAGQPLEVHQIFPTTLPSWTTEWNREHGVLRVQNPTGSVGARVLRLTTPRAGA